MRWFVFSLILAASAFAAPSAVAQTREDYVFNVPVRIENTPPLNGQDVRILCAVDATVGGAFVRVPSVMQLVRVGPTGYRGTVRLAITLPEGVRRSDVSGWYCQMQLLHALSPSGVRTEISGANVELKVASYTAVSGQAVASRNVHRSGTFSR